MTKAATTVLVIASLAGVAFATVAAQSQGASTRWEYTRLEGIQQTSSDGNGFRFIYRACQAASGDWHCRSFTPEPTFSADMAFREALFTLGQDGWELVATVSPHENGEPSYLFKRQRPPE